MAGYLTKEDLATHLAPIILEMLQDESDEERRFLGIRVMDELAETFGFEICRDLIMYEFVSLQDDPVFKIRRELILRLSKLSKVLGE